MKIYEALQWGERKLKEAEVDNPRWDADLLLSQVMGWRREQLYLEREGLLANGQWESYQALIIRRSAREPLQYILKNQEFMGLSFYVDERVLIPRADSEILVEKLLEFKNSTTQARIRIADLCTGSGALAVAIAHYWPEASVVGTDLSSAALEVASYNGQRNDVRVEWRKGDFCEPIRGERWDWIVSNPPYVPEEEYRSLAPEIFKEPEMAFVGAENGLIFYQCLAEEAASLLNVEGKILMEIGWHQGQSVQNLFQKQGFKTQIFQDYGGRDRVVCAEFIMR
ncbi:peptide chain release factor N(5)-glutamine methyltransferase [Desulfitobacterium sp.]|uniref:peptide chain release factor N(5)-glutamine methyltransferase n=1 Tax=Desulfitobacterium sp. TaxID=49981 RepID=UPI002B5B0506|nr:peptide chain release factor N(5)-glutamine methyltransferase [Desulfitobacterium sp.]HVJ49203.1 peptide chain release factor N(5)-glutamine methyltransferase [Desulfitobacterium sp.]